MRLDVNELPFLRRYLSHDLSKKETTLRLAVGGLKSGLHRRLGNGPQRARLILKVQVILVYRGIHDSSVVESLSR